MIGSSGISGISGSPKSQNKYITDKGSARFFDTFIHFIESPNAPETTKTIYLGTNLPAGFDGILYNTEQLTVPDKFKQLIESITKNPGIEVWDYSQVNIGILAKANSMAKYIPLFSPTWYIEKLRSYRSEMAYDIGFNGSPSPRRDTVIQKLRGAGFKVLHSSSWGEERDRELSKCRILINIHYNTDYLIFETARCEPWLQLGVPIISELSVINDPRCIHTTYDGFVDTVVRYFDTVKNQG